MTSIANRFGRYFLAVSFLTTANLGQAAVTGQRPPRPMESVRQAPYKKISELPPLTEVSLVGGSITDSMRTMGVTRGVEPGVTVPFLLSQKPVLDTDVKNGFQVYQNIDIVQFEVDAIQDFLSGKGIFSGEKDPSSSRGFIVLRYGLEDDRALEMFKQVRKTDIHSALLVTDGPITMDGDKAQFGTRTDRMGKTVPEDFSNDIRPEYLMTHANGPDVKSMLDSGYKLYSPVLPKKGNLVEKGDFYVAMSAVANPANDRKPIMHEKEVVMYILKDPTGPVVMENIKKLYVIHGTGNWTRVHYNRNFIYEDNMKSEDGPGKFAFRHAVNTLETFVREGQTAKISDIPTPGRMRLNDKDGFFWEMAYTDGKYELNQRIADRLNVMAGDEETLQRLSNGNADEYKHLKEVSENVEVKEILLSHFVMTNMKVVEALFNLWTVQKAKGKPFWVRGALDAKFVGLRSFGLGALMAGYDTKTQFGRTRRALGKEFAKYVDVAVQLEEVPDAKNINPDGPPSDRILWHDKTTMITYQMKGDAQARSDLFTGSYNNSNNFNNLERQDWYSIPAESALIKAVETSVKSGIKISLKGNKKALPLEKAVFVKELATFLGQSPIDLDWTMVLGVRARLESLHTKTPEERQELLKDLGYKMMKEGLRPSRLIKSLQLSKDDLRTRIEAMGRFFTWYSSQPFYRQGFDVAISANEMLSLGLAVQESPMSAKFALKDIFWRPNVPNHVIEARAFKIYQYMGLEAVFAQKLTKYPDDKKPFPSAKFPFSEDITFSVDLMDPATQKSVAELMQAGKNADAAKLLAQWLQANKDALGDKLGLAATADEIQKRLTGFSDLLKWYQGLQAEPTYKYKVADLQSPELVSQLLSENLDLLLLKDQPQQKVQDTVKYIISLKGYQDLPKGVPGILSEKTTEAVRVLTGVSVTMDTTVPRVASPAILPAAGPAAPSAKVGGGGAGPVCPQVFLGTAASL